MLETVALKCEMKGRESSVNRNNNFLVLPRQAILTLLKVINYPVPLIVDKYNSTLFGTSGSNGLSLDWQEVADTRVIFRSSTAICLLTRR